MDYSAKFIKAGNSSGFRFEAAFFKRQPDFRNGARAKVLGTGAVLLVADPGRRRGKPVKKTDPVVSSFLSFLERGMKDHPELIAPLDKKVMDNIGALVKGVERD